METLVCSSKMESLTRTNTPLLPVTRTSARKPKCSFFKATCCIRSKAARYVLLWNFAVLLAYRGFYNIDAIMQVNHSPLAPVAVSIGITSVAAISPVAGLLTDIKFSRYRAVLHSSYLIAVKLLVAIPIMTLILVALLTENTALLIILLLSSLAGLAVFVTVYVVFIINAFQFGMDQLHDAPTDDSILFIHWYMWIYHTCALITETIENLLFYDFYNGKYLDSIRISGLCLLGFIYLTVLTLLIISICTLRRGKVLFLLEPAGVNPYKLLYKVTKFVYQHKVPIRRSAFTYCTEEIPSRMDVGKHKYGGPFTTKQVEDVKSFWGILKVVLSTGPAFFLQATTQSILPAFAKHNNIFLLNDTNVNSTMIREVHLEGVARYILISNGLLSPLLVAICIPLYLCWIRPCIRYHVPGTLKRIGLAIVVMILSLVCTFVMDFVVHSSNTESAGCMFRMYIDLKFTDSTTINNFPAHPLYQNVYFFTSQHVLSAVANMLLDISVLEFICSQSPYSMKGLLLSMFITMKGLFQGIAITSIAPFGAAWSQHALSCGSGFYLLNIAIGLVTFLVYTCISKRYKYREVNEPSNEYRYAEEYYSHIE